jgi:hypothetical protein
MIQIGKEKIEKIKIEIETLGSAFDDEYFDGGFNYEVARILKNLAFEIKEGYRPVTIMDINGNRVGTITYKEE